ncbi:MAG: AFG1/ZapE family ATPase, partial [Rhodoplanes sp.]
MTETRSLSAGVQERGGGPDRARAGRPMSVSGRYAAIVGAGEIERDLAQEAVVAKLDALHNRLKDYELERKSSVLGRLFSRRAKKAPLTPVRGLYVYGEVGRGKTMLLDLFFAICTVKRKRRAHFHEFMADVHDRIHAYR